MSLFLSIVLDGVGIGEQPDAVLYGDEGSDTLGHVCAAEKPHLPNLSSLGLGNIKPLENVAATTNPRASFGKMTEVSAGKDSTTGHWELAGLTLDKAFPTYPDGFPTELLDAFCEKTGYQGVLGNIASSGTAIIEQFGAEHQKSGFPIAYTSADSVFQVAAHVETIPLDELYRICQIARSEIFVGDHAVGRVIARPFEGEEGSYRRISEKRRDFSFEPTKTTLQEALQKHGIQTIAIGKIGDLFANKGFDQILKTKSNADGIQRMHAVLNELAEAPKPTFIWTNLVDFDQEFGHRNNVKGFAKALEEFDQALPDLLAALPDGANMFITADHGNDPTTPSTDHSREFVPFLHFVSGQSGQDLGTRATFADHAATVAHYFGMDFPCNGKPLV
jgi:phosphopentomutase